MDNIEQNVSKSVDHIIVAKEQTKKAVRFQTKARKVICFKQLLVQAACDLILFSSACFTDTFYSFLCVTLKSHSVHTDHTPSPCLNDTQ